MKASVFPGSSGEPLFLNLILCKRRVKLSFPIMGSTGGHGVSAKRFVKKAECPISGHSAFSIAW